MGLRFSQGLADQTYSNHLARLAQLSGLGGNVANQQGKFAVASGQGTGNALTDAGNARASGYSAIGRGISGGFNFLAGLAGASGFPSPGNAFGSGLGGPIY